MGILSGLFGKKQENPAPQEERTEATSGEPAGEQDQVFQQEREGEAPDFHKLIWHSSESACVTAKGNIWTSGPNGWI